MAAFFAIRSVFDASDFLSIAAAHFVSVNRLPANTVESLNKKQKSAKIQNFLNFPPIIVYRIFVQIAIGWAKKFGYFSAKLFSIFLTNYWKFVLQSVIMDYANMICDAKQVTG